jgi:hypothetical protein
MSIEYVEIYPKIHVYKNVFKDAKDFLNKALELDGWEGWYSFGRMRSLQIDTMEYKNFPTKDEYIISTHKTGIERELTLEIESIFYDVTSHYVNMHNISLDNWVHHSPVINEYIPGGGISDHYAMNYHTDYIPFEAENPGLKFGITNTFYLNDDYEEGEICFKIGEDYISYKPEAGDAMCFPSTRPYLHGVAKAVNGYRYIGRTFWQYKYNGSEEWLKNEEKYGKEVWAEMEKERISQERMKTYTSAEDLHDLKGRDNHKFGLK